VKFIKSEKRDIIDLRLQQQTLNVFLNRKFVECSQKKSIIVKIKVLNQTLMTQNNEMQSNLITVKINKF